MGFDSSVYRASFTDPIGRQEDPLVRYSRRLRALAGPLSHLVLAEAVTGGFTQNPALR